MDNRLTGVLFALVLPAMTLAGCAGGSVQTTPLAGASTPTTPTSFATIVGPPSTLSTTSQAVAVPTVAGVSTVGGSIAMSTTSGSGSAVVTVASAASAGSSGGPPATLTASARRSAQDFGGTTIAPQYYVGVTNTGSGPTQVTIPNLSLNVNVQTGQSAGLAHYDPSYPQNGWNQHCAFGSGQVNTNGGTTTFTPGGTGNATFTIYPGATLWFAPYTYASGSVATPTAPPSSTAVTPTPAPAPASLTGTYVGSAQQTSPSSQAAQYLEFTLTQTGSSLSGTYAVLPNAGGQNGSFGSLSGTVSGGNISLTASAQYGGSCTTTLSGVASGSLVGGTFASAGQCGGAGTFSAALQSGSLPSISGNYSGPITDSGNGNGTLTLNVSTPGTVFSGTGTVSFPSNPSAGGSSAIVGFVTSATTGEFAVIGGPGGNCQPNGVLTISNNGGTLAGDYTGGGNGNNSCSGTGKFTISH